MRLLDGKSCGYLEPVSDQMFRPLILMVTKDDHDRDVLVGFCVDNPTNQTPAKDKSSLISTFNRLFKENIKYNMISTVVDQIWTENVKVGQNDLNPENNLKSRNDYIIGATNESRPRCSSNGITNIVELARSVLNTTRQEAENKILSKDNLAINNHLLNAFKGTLSNVKDDIPIGSVERDISKCDMSLIFKSHADWKMNFYDKSINYLALFVDHCFKDEEHVIFCQDSINLLSYLTDIYDTSFKVSSIANKKGIISHPQIGKEIQIRVIEDLSSFEQHFFKLGAFEEDAIIVEMEILKNLCEQFEIKHESKVMIIPKLESSPPFIFCSVTSKETLERIETIDNDTKEKNPSISFKRAHHNPDEIIEGRPKWSKIKLLRKSDILKHGEEKVEEEILDFDRLNPHRSNVPEFDDNFDNTDDAYQKVVLKMMADLQSETVVILGNSRLVPEKDKKHMKEFLDWEKYKKDHNLQSADFVTKKKSKVDERLKIKNKIITKNPRKVST